LWCIRKSGGFFKSGGIIYGSDAPEALANKAQGHGAVGWALKEMLSLFSHGAKLAHYSGFNKTVNEETELPGSGWEWDSDF
jgi:hypothetical protein